MTSLQREFCRHYLRGLPAPKAALAAGYAPGTAERDCADILSAPAVQAHIERHRAASRIFCTDDIAKTRDKLMALQDHGNPMVAIAAAREFRQLLKQFPDLQLSEPSDLQFSEIQENPSQQPDNKPDTDIKNIQLPYGPPIESYDQLTSNEKIKLMGTLQKDYFAHQRQNHQATEPPVGGATIQPTVKPWESTQPRSQPRQKHRHPHHKNH